MTWFRVDDGFYDHPKVVGLPDGAIALWLKAGCWAARNLTDGFVPRKIAKTIGSERFAAELCRVALWRTVPGGYQFHDWTEWNPTREQVERKRRLDRDRQARFRTNARVTRESRASNAASNGVTGRKQQVRPLAQATRDSARPDHTPNGVYARARGAPDGPAAPAPGTPEARRIAEQGLALVKEAMQKGRNGRRADSA